MPTQSKINTEDILGETPLKRDDSCADYSTPNPNSKTRKIKAIIDNEEKYVTFKYDSAHIKLTFSEAENFKKVYSGGDIYICLAKVREDFPDIKFLCKGAKINVRPSSMASQMSGGMVAYELTMGKRPTREDLVHIFDHEEHNLTNNPQEQTEFYKDWLASVGAERNTHG